MRALQLHCDFMVEMEARHLLCEKLKELRKRVLSMAQTMWSPDIILLMERSQFCWCSS